MLKKNGTYNKNHEKVKKDKFREGGFYDPMDIVQVRYEMIKEAGSGEKPVGDVTGEYGYSRASYYHVREGFEQGGVAALIPEKTGPKGARKLTGDLQEYIAERLELDPSVSSSEIAMGIEREKGVSISKRTIERFRSKKKL